MEPGYGETDHAHHEGFLAKAIDKLEPIPVTIVKKRNADGDIDDTEDLAAKWGAWKTIKFLTGAEGPQQLLPQSPFRKRALISVGNGYLNNNNVGYLVVGSRGQVQNAGVTGDVGGVLWSGWSGTIESASEVWITGDGTHSLTVTVLDERYH